MWSCDFNQFLPFLFVQLGYIVHTSVKTNGDDIKGLLFLIQSDSYDPIYMDERIEVFLISLRMKLLTMSEEEFNANVNALIQTFEEKNKNVGEESNKYWSAICNQHYLFKRLNIIASKLKTATKTEVLQFYDKYIAKCSPQRRKLSIQVFAKQHMENYHNEVENGVSLIFPENVDEFKNGSSLFPLTNVVDLEPFKMV